MAAVIADGHVPYEVTDIEGLFGTEFCAKLIWEKMSKREDFRVLPWTGCWYNIGPTGLGIGPRGYMATNRTIPWRRTLTVQPSSRVQTLTLRFHRVSFVAFYGRNPTHTGISHLCAFRRCFNPLHLIDEHMSPNIYRKYCRGQVYCYNHGPHPKLVINFCSHEPECILPNLPENIPYTLVPQSPEFTIPELGRFPWPIQNAICCGDSGGHSLNSGVKPQTVIDGEALHEEYKARFAPYTPDEFVSSLWNRDDTSMDLEGIRDRLNNVRNTMVLAMPGRREGSMRFAGAHTVMGHTERLAEMDRIRETISLASRRVRGMAAAMDTGNALQSKSENIIYNEKNI